MIDKEWLLRQIEEMKLKIPAGESNLVRIFNDLLEDLQRKINNK